MSECKVTFHPVFAQVIKNAAEPEEARTRLQADIYARFIVGRALEA